MVEKYIDSMIAKKKSPEREKERCSVFNICHSFIEQLSIYVEQIKLMNIVKN